MGCGGWEGLKVSCAPREGLEVLELNEARAIPPIDLRGSIGIMTVSIRHGEVLRATDLEEFKVFCAEPSPTTRKEAWKAGEKSLKDFKGPDAAYIASKSV